MEKLRMNYRTCIVMLCITSGLYAQDIFLRDPWSTGLNYTVDQKMVTPWGQQHGYESMRTLLVSRSIIPLFIRECGRIVHGQFRIDDYGSSWRSHTPNCGDCRRANIKDWYGYRPDWRGCGPLLVAATIHAYRHRETLKKYGKAGYAKIIAFLHNTDKDKQQVVVTQSPSQLAVMNNKDCVRSSINNS